MQAKILRVVQQGEAFAVQSQKSEGGQTMKCNIVLGELDKFGNQYVATLLGDSARLKLAAGTLVLVTLKFSTREFNGVHYQDILATTITPLTD